MIAPDLTQPIPDQLGHVHFVGIGGSGMSGIARMMHQRGLEVTGSDREENYSTAALEDEGIPVKIGHSAEHIDGVDTLVVTSALWPDNPELVAAQQRGTPVLHRSQALAWLTRNHDVIAVAGAHGKTTTTGMMVVALQALGDDPSFVNGGIISQLGVSSGTGQGPHFVLEADESDGSFLLYQPAVALVTNIDTDHLDHYGTMENLEAAFVEFASRSSKIAVVSADNEMVRQITPKITAPVATFGVSDDATVRVIDPQEQHGGISATIAYNGAEYALHLQVPGLHNALNAAGVFTTLVELGFNAQEIIDALGTFTGTKRRFDLHGVVDGVRVYDDYAHHPTEVAAVLEAAHSVVDGHKVIAVQQPHLYSRTKAMADQFAKVLEQNADHTVMLDVCGAREDPIPGVTGATVADKFADPSHVTYVPDWADAAAEIAKISDPGDIVITLGCGDVYRIIPSVLEALKARTPRSHEDSAQQA